MSRYQQESEQSVGPVRSFFTLGAKSSVRRPSPGDAVRKGPQEGRPRATTTTTTTSLLLFAPGHRVPVVAGSAEPLRPIGSAAAFPMLVRSQPDDDGGSSKFARRGRALASDDDDDDEPRGGYSSQSSSESDERSFDSDQESGGAALLHDETALPPEPEPASTAEEKSKLSEMLQAFVAQRQQYEEQLDGIRDFFSKATEELADLACELYLLNAEVMTLEDPALYERVRLLSRGMSKSDWPTSLNA